MAAVERIEGWRTLGDNIIETIINKSDKIKEIKDKGKTRDLTDRKRKYLLMRKKSTSLNESLYRRN